MLLITSYYITHHVALNDIAHHVALRHITPTQVYNARLGSRAKRDSKLRMIQEIKMKQMRMRMSPGSYVLLYQHIGDHLNSLVCRQQQIWGQGLR